MEKENEENKKLHRNIHRLVEKEMRWCIDEAERMKGLVDSIRLDLKRAFIFHDHSKFPEQYFYAIEDSSSSLEEIVEDQVETLKSILEEVKEACNEQ